MAAASRLGAAAAAPIPVVYVLDQLWNAGGGTETQFLTLLRNLDRRKFEPTVILLRGADGISTRLRDVPVQLLNIQKLASVRFFAQGLQVVRYLRRRKIRLAHIFLNDAALGFPPFLRLGGARVIVSRRDLGFWYTPKNLRVLRAVRPTVAAVIANCDAVKQVVTQKEGYEPSQIAVIHNGFEPRGEMTGRAEARRRIGVEADRPMITIVANLRPLKRIDDAIRAIALVREEFPDVLLNVVGEDPPHQGAASHGTRLRELAAELGVSGNVVFSGLQNDPMRFVEAANACLLCSETEGLSNSIIEYMWAGRATVATQVGGNAELITHGETGFLVPVGDFRKIAEHLRTLLRAPSEQMGEKARAFAIAHFAPQVMAERHAKLYLELLGQGAGARSA